MSNGVIRTTALLLLGTWTTITSAGSIPIENASFEAPSVDPNAFSAVPFVDGWIEIDVDTETSANTGVFANPAEGDPGRLAGADGNQLAFLGSQAGNALEQDLTHAYKAGCDYRLTVAVGVSGMFPPSVTEPLDTLELVLYYTDANNAREIACQTIDATGLSSTELIDYSLHVPAVQTGDPWAGTAIGVALRSAGAAGGFWDIDNVRLIESVPASISIENASFEAPVVDPNGFGAVPFADGWTEIDLDAETGTNTGVFANTAADSPDHVINADGVQLAFLGSETGNAFVQDLIDTYKVGCDYRLTVAVGVSNMFPPSMVEPVDMLELVLFHRDANDVVEIAHQSVQATGFSSTELVDFSLYLPAVQPDDAWAGMNIGIGLHAAGMPGGFWDIDNVRLTESLPVSIPIENASFELPVVDPNGFPAVPFVAGWTEIDVDTEASTNTGVFANTSPESWDHKTNADGNQLVFLGSQAGNAIEQDLTAVYEVGCDYRLTVVAGVSSRYAPSSEIPVDLLELALYYRDGTEVVDIASRTIDATGLSPLHSKDISLYLPTVQPGDAWTGAGIGVALRSIGMPGGFWALDNVRLAKSPADPDSAPTIKQ